MGNIFSGSEVVEIGIEIEKNGRDFYNSVINLSKNAKTKEMFGFLAKEEEKHIKIFESLLSQVKRYDPSEAYPGEYFAYLKALSEGHVFTKANKGVEIAKKINNQKEAIDAGIGFEKDSILFYHEMKRFVLEGEREIINNILEEEQGHLSKLTELRKDL